MASLMGRFEREVFTPYVELLKAQYRIHPTFAHAKEVWEAELKKEVLLNGPYLEKSLSYAPGVSVDSLHLHKRTIEAVRRRLGGHPLYWHQTEALKLLLHGRNAVIATGTSSGKTLCFQIPILDDLFRDPTPGLRAVVIYPLNALVNDQLDEWGVMLRGSDDITFARFTGQTPRSQVEYEARLKEATRERLRDSQLTQEEREREVGRLVKEQLSNSIPNHLNHREAIRASPPHLLITNFSMLEYLLERPVDAPIFENARLKFLVLDEAHAYRGVQATEIAFLIRRLKDRLRADRVTCIATSATLGKAGDEEAAEKVRRFASSLFAEEFGPPNPIHGKEASLALERPSFLPTASMYIRGAGVLRDDPDSEVASCLGAPLPPATPLGELLLHDENLLRLRKDILSRPRLVAEAARELWPSDPEAEDGLEALLEIVAAARGENAQESLLPTRLHYFVKAQDGLHVCLRRDCPGRKGAEPAFFVSRKSSGTVEEGHCPKCHEAGRQSKLVEVVTCRKCGYLFGALQDMGPRRAQSPDPGSEPIEAHFDSFSTELGWGADSFWSYFSVEEELPYPTQMLGDEEDEDSDDLLLHPAELDWCAACGKKHDRGAGDNCSCQEPHLRRIKIYHRQCPHSGKSKDRMALYSQEKKPLTRCPNCGARNASGLEPVRRFQESDDETGLAMAIPLAHFQVTADEGDGRPVRKLLCFADHRQRAAAFPALLEEETFTHDMGRKIVSIVREAGSSVGLIDLGERLAGIADPDSESFDFNFFLPVSRLPDEDAEKRVMTNLWIAEVFAYFGIPDAARESAEDLALVAVEYRLRAHEDEAFRRLLPSDALSEEEAFAALQVLLGFVRKRKAFTLPKRRVENDAPAFGRITADIGFVLRRQGLQSTHGWLPRVNADSSYRDNVVTDYIRRLSGLAPEEVLYLCERIWEFLTSQYLLLETSGEWKLDHERLAVLIPRSRYACSRCGTVTPYCARFCCPRKECDGRLEERPFVPAEETIIARWVAGEGRPTFTTLKSEEHTAQIEKDLARRIEEEFRRDGVNLLSSTTTFEMGINIGDLQKVLLRNAPPSSANYVQRIGRVGRGREKNCICVTLCRRSKYDADVWKEPERMMSGRVRAPTVFVENAIIAQRHFNAVVFGHFLREKLRGEQLLGPVEQRIRLESFIPPDRRSGLPDSWRRVNPTGLHLDFGAWMKEKEEGDFLGTDAGLSLIGALSCLNDAKARAIDSYEDITGTLGEELAQLLGERSDLHGRGSSTGDADRAIKNLIGSDVIEVLAHRGFLPRYAFPLDVVTLETGRSRWSRDTEVELSRDRGMAIAEFAPGAQVIAHKKVFTSAGLYILTSKDRPEVRWFSKCPGCGQIRTAITQDALLGSCTVCDRAITRQHLTGFVQPSSFSIRVGKGSEGAERHRRATLIRQRQTLTHFIDSVEEDEFEDLGQFRIALKKSGKLFRYNLGPEGKRFMLCPKCGFSESMRLARTARRHKRLRPCSGTMDCDEKSLYRDVAFGHEFESFCLIARPIAAPCSVESVAFALQKGLCSALDVEPVDVGVAWRWLTKRSEGMPGVEIVFYDTAPGGAGFVQDARDNWETVVEKALGICKRCLCERACYDCLKDYRNQAYHERLDRGAAAENLES